MILYLKNVTLVKSIINLRTFIQESDLFIEIQDSGHGIPEKSINKIFVPGFTTKGVGVSTGLGLSISYNIMQKHQGNIHVKSELGAGTTFSLQLPLNLKANFAARSKQSNTEKKEGS